LTRVSFGLKIAVATGTMGDLLTAVKATMASKMKLTTAEQALAKIKDQEITVKATYKFTSSTAITAAAAKTAIATSCSVQESAVTVTAAAGGRRLNARRLAEVSFDAVIVTDATNAAAVKTAANNAATIGTNAAATVVVTTAPAVEVSATVQVESITPITQDQVSTTVLNEIAVAAAGAGATASLKSGSFTSKVAGTGTTAAPSSDAGPATTSSAVGASAFVAQLLVLAAYFTL
jgi:hypothetical protein